MTTKEQAEAETQALRQFAKTNQIRQLPYRCKTCEGFGVFTRVDSIYGEYTATCTQCKGTGWKDGR